MIMLLPWNIKDVIPTARFQIQKQFNWTLNILWETGSLPNIHTSYKRLVHHRADIDEMIINYYN